MNKLDKQIIEIIEPYMDKTLSEGCLISWIYQGKVFIEKYLDENSQGIITLEELIDEKENEYFKLGAIIENYKIIGHYDITAVLKYIKNKETCPYNLEYTFDLRDKGFISINKLERGFNSIYKEKEFSKIPLKPLHLYTDEEKTNLLELLLKLKNEN